MYTFLKSTISLSFQPADTLKAQFHILNSVDSTNNYAIGRINDGLACPGEAWFTEEQTAGRGQFGKSWTSEYGANVLMSVVIEPNQALFEDQFHCNMDISLLVRDFIQKMTSSPVLIKWPNDIYINDRKAGGILIESKFQGKIWKWAVIGVGINVNQQHFEPDLHAVSLCTLTDEVMEPKSMAMDLHKEILEFFQNGNKLDTEGTLSRYNRFLFRKGDEVRLIIDDMSQLCKIREVDQNGYLNIECGGKLRKLKNGEVIWKL